MTIEEKLITGQFMVEPEQNQITFMDTRFYTNDGQNFYPSVTTILEAFPKDAAFYKWLKENGEDADRIRDDAGVHGSLVHGLTEKYDNGDVVSLFDSDGKIRYSSKAWSQFEKYVEYRNKFNIEILLREVQFISDKYKTGGTIDKVVRFNDESLPKLLGKKYIVDIKTSNALHDSYWCQMARYKKLYEEVHGEEIDGIAILWLNAKTRTDGKKGDLQGKGWQMVFPDQPIEYYDELFDATEKLWWHMNKDARPRNTVYTLEHKYEEKRVLA
jgi:hypothetical protein